jgi:hypothetical protein
LQDRYVADVGDYAKFGLLRALASSTITNTPFTLTVIWYLMPNEAHNADGRHTQFVHDYRLRECDPYLHDALGSIISQGNRSIVRLETCGILPTSYTTYYSETIPCARPHPRRRLPPGARKRWFAGAMKASETADLVFLDPDNGLAGASVSYASTRAGKYVFLEELKSFVDRDQSVLLYQHHHRQSSTETQVTNTLERLQFIVSPGTKMFSFTFRKGSVRSFYLIPSKMHTDAIRHNVGVLKNGPWGAFFGIIGL